MDNSCDFSPEITREAPSIANEVELSELNGTFEGLPINSLEKSDFDPLDIEDAEIEIPCISLEESEVSRLENYTFDGLLVNTPGKFPSDVEDANLSIATPRPQPPPNSPNKSHLEEELIKEASRQELMIQAQIRKAFIPAVPPNTPVQGHKEARNINDEIAEAAEAIGAELEFQPYEIVNGMSREKIRR